jgi:molybdopterin-containing oxidoreductase family iron-sulfur binding subunit
MAPIHSSRAVQDSFIALAKGAGLRTRGLLAAAVSTSWYEYLKANWKENYLRGGSFDTAWENALRDGIVKNAPTRSASTRAFRGAALALVPPFKAAVPGYALAFYTKTAILDGNRANNPWLQEMPDPITTTTWDNYWNMSPATATKLGLKSDDVIEVESNGIRLALPLNVQPGLHPDVITAAIGYGREAAGKIGDGVGRDVKIFVKGAQFAGMPANVHKTGRRYQVATTQWHNASENRPIVNDLSIAEFRANPGASNHTDPHMRMEEVPTMWPKHKYPGYRWGMAIDLNACTGCGSCIIACQAENNIPVVGRDNVRKSREMHWIRIDRYYSGSPENPDVVFQPMLCQHCENAPCETVCPVVATVHDNEGLNSQIYNRCVGTRYCQNNCPYKVRRFNFFDHWKAYEGSMNLAWNPDVTVRTRGIMEKCTFCVQRLRDGKDKAKDEGRKLRDLEVKVACQQTCPTDAIVFGDINDQGAVVTKTRGDLRAFRVLEVLNTVPVISYLSKVRNKEGGGAHHATDAHGDTGKHDDAHSSGGGH